VSAARAVYLGLMLLDRQLVDRNGKLVGNVDDLELTVDADGRLIVTAILAGPGVLAERMGAERLGRWLQAVHRSLKRNPERLVDPGGDPARIPFGRVRALTSRVDLSAVQEELGTQTSHAWAAEHVIGHVPGRGWKPGEGEARS
jgi:hypothetical protein